MEAWEWLLIGVGVATFFILFRWVQLKKREDRIRRKKRAKVKCSHSNQKAETKASSSSKTSVNSMFKDGQIQQGGTSKLDNSAAQMAPGGANSIQPQASNSPGKHQASALNQVQPQTPDMNQRQPQVLDVIQTRLQTSNINQSQPHATNANQIQRPTSGVNRTELTNLATPTPAPADRHHNSSLPPAEDSIYSSNFNLPARPVVSYPADTPPNYPGALISVNNDQSSYPAPPPYSEINSSR